MKSNGVESTESGNKEGAGEVPRSRGARFFLCLTVLGIVYGDIGTSPLYATRVCFSPGCGVPPSAANILGIVSMILWSLFMLITIKYMALVLRANNNGEGGILALMALVTRSPVARKRLFVIIGLFGAALLYGDGLIAPAISVLSAIEGLNMGALVVPPRAIMLIALAALIILFGMQRHGTQTVGSIFGPIMLVWFIALAALGTAAIVQAPGILAAVNPRYAIEFFVNNRLQAFITMGAVFLAVTGGETLYADLGHFGTGPIRRGWFYLVMPALMLTYAGQGAWMLKALRDPANVTLVDGLAVLNPHLIENLFFRNIPHWAIYPMVALATASTIIASQAIISGAFSMTRQAIQLGYLPRLAIVHTSSRQIGQVYLPLVKWFMLAGTIVLVLGFRNSANLAGAYGMAVSLTMLITTLLLLAVMRRIWNWPQPVVLLIAVPFLSIDLMFFGSNILKIGDGGWAPLVIATCFMAIMTTWYRGREILAKRTADSAISIDLFIQDVINTRPHRVPGVAVFLTGHANIIPRTLLHNFKHNKILHQQIVLLTIRTEEVPHIPEQERIQATVLPEGFYQLLIRYGFSEDPDLSSILKTVKLGDLNLDPMKITFFLGRETLILGKHKTMHNWRKGLFAYLSRNAWDASKYFRIPTNRVIELGIQVEL